MSPTDAPPPWLSGSYHPQASAAWTTSANASYDPGACEPILSTSYSGPDPTGSDFRGAHGHDHQLDAHPEPAAGPSPPAPPPSPGLPVGIEAAGPAVLVGDPAAAPLATQRFVSFRTILLLHDDLDPTRQMLARHQVGEGL